MYDKNNIFSKIIRGEIPSKKVFEDDHVLAFHDIQPAAPVHILVIPKKEYTSFHDFAENALPEEIKHFFRVVRDIAEEQNISEAGYRIITNHGIEGGQSVPHFHVHLLGGKKQQGL